MNSRTSRVCVALGLALSLALVAQAADLPKITHDWPGYTGPDGTYADQSKVPLLDDLSQAKLLWTSEHAGMGYGKTTSGGGHRYGPSQPAGSCCLIVADGLVIATYFTPKNNVVADDVILALDAATGKTKWKQVYRDKGYNRSARKHVQYGPTPAAADGKVFHLGSGGCIYCVELATGKTLWESSLSDHPARFKAAVAKMEVKPETKDGCSAEIKARYSTPLTVIGGVLMIADERLYAYDTATGKELWRIDGVTRMPSPAKLNAVVYGVCTGADKKTRLFEPKTGKVLWAEKLSTPGLLSQPSDICADGRLFVPLAADDTAKKGQSPTPKMAAYALSETGAKLLWQSKDDMLLDGFYAYRDGMLFANMPAKRIQVYKADDGTLLSDYDSTGTGSTWGQFHLWGDRIILIGDHCHESIGTPQTACTYQSLTPGYKDLKALGKPLTPRTFDKYIGVGGYIECWMRPAFADGLMFNRSVNSENGHGAILCWDLRAKP